MSTDSVNAPTLSFPPPGPILPPLPDSYIVPKLTDDFNSSDLRWYLQTAVNEPNFRPKEGFGSLNASIRTRDHIAQEFDGLHGYSLTLYCLACNPLDNVLANDEEEVWRACNNDMTNAKATVATIPNSEMWQPYSDLRIRVPTLDPSTHTIGSANDDRINMRVCMTVLWLNKNFTYIDNKDNFVRSQLFLVRDQLHDEGQSSETDYIPYVYNATYPLGTTIRQHFTIPLAASSTRMYHPADLCISVGRSDSCHGDAAWDHWPIGKRFGVTIGGVAGAALVLWLVRRFCERTRWANVRQKPRPMLLSELRAQQREREGHNTDEERDVGAIRRGPREEPQAIAAGRNGIVDEGEIDKPPPGYHEVVNDQERILATYATQSHLTMPAPFYEPPGRNSDSLSAHTIYTPPAASLPQYTPAAGVVYYPPPPDR
ncbi:hypothetical protein P153DRAFT_355209 [Dothidotthia symphoricarpi CBS 119687]|uniref:Uncharacterized protein n=1 Tax=Dothidotthia symphoricarpi CBS 119687 TaxID=1392245 RepID=A0A6A6AHI9_9PLEO|nr:uncharacterized protein P153DRAFT_355209 [Dothidotthia symphoricarpi CBS 119687]KAF2131419.1 hypothetical protein P153DRAFT_355209 [Dothidotthia symphoricarpi CBS 119687]